MMKLLLSLKTENQKPYSFQKERYDRLVRAGAFTVIGRNKLAN